MPELGEDVYYSSVADLNRRLLAREFSCEQLTRAFATRLEQLGPRFNALALPLRLEALRRAKDVDDDLKRDRTRGPLQGIPYAAKDLLSWAGHPTTWGAQPYAGQVFDYTATALKRLDGRGATLIGKLAMVELAGGGGYRYAAASMFGPGLNPWDHSRWAGGSSSGSGSAVAAGLVPFALGSETWGSILTPAAFCGVTGLRPTYGLVSRYGAMALSWTMDKIGPLCRTAEDCGLVLQVIAGKDGNDPASAGKSFYYTPQYAREIGTIRVGFHPVDFAEWAEPEAREAFTAAFDVFRKMGVTPVETQLPDYPYRSTAWCVISSEGSAIFEPLIRSGAVEQLADRKQIAGLKAGLDIPASAYLKAMRVRSLVRRDVRRMFADVDVLCSASVFGPAPPIDQPLDAPNRKGAKPKQRGLSDLGAAGNLAGLPALSLPCGFAGKLPVALQLVGLPFSENTLIALGREFQKRTAWHMRRPPL